MKDVKEKLRLKCAEVDGYVDIHNSSKSCLGPFLAGTLNGSYKIIPKYISETDILRVVRLLDEDEFEEYCGELHEVCGRNCEVWVEVKATADQMLEALAKVWGIS